MTKGDKKICLNKADSELYVICDVQNSGVSVATSDGLEQLIAIGQGAMRISARGLREELIRLRSQGEEAASAYRSSGFSQPLAELRNWEKEDS